MKDIPLFDFYEFAYEFLNYVNDLTVSVIVPKNNYYFFAIHNQLYISHGWLIKGICLN